MASTTSGQPKYLQIAAELRQAIAAGDYTPGTRLPGENDLMSSYQVARETARKALAQLINEGLAAPRKGAGVFVREFRPIVRDGIQRLSGQTWPAGKSIWGNEAEGRELTVDQVSVTEAEAPSHIAVLLDLAEGERVVVRNRRYVLDGKPVLVSRSYLPAKLVAGSQITQADTGPGGTYARLRDLGHSPIHFREDLRARMPELSETQDLALIAGTPVVEMVRTAYAEDSRPVEINEMIADAGAYILRYDFDAV
jgi:GntR family transcriptional regulator